MNAAELLAWRIAGGQAAIRHYCELAGEKHWLQRPVPGQNLLGFTLWHSATTVDWIVNAFIRGRPEIRFDDRWSGRGMPTETMPFGMTLEEADHIAAGASAITVAEYSKAVQDDVLPWVESLGGDDLESRAPTRENLETYRGEKTDVFLREVDWMWDATVRELLGRPCMGHVFFHSGEVAVGLEVVKARVAA